MISHPLRNDAARRMTVMGAAVAMAGLLFSGPAALGALAMIRRSLGWIEASEYAQHFYRLQAAPFLFGFVLMVGYLMLFAGLHELAGPEARPRATAALLFAAAYGAVISINYIAQTTFIPALATRYTPSQEGVLDALSLANPRSLAWAMEMWGYALLGAATWFAAAIFREGRIERWIARLMVLNGVASLAAAIAAAWDMAWITTAVGLAAYVGWNVLMLTLSILIVIALSPRRRAA